MLPCLALLLLGDVWLVPSLVAIALYYEFNYISAKRAELERMDEFG